MEKVKFTQTERIYGYLVDFGSINPIQALSDLGVMRLASRISDLRKAGVPISRRMVKGTNRYGETVSFAEYSLEV